jgi:hypothetical protein
MGEGRFVARRDPTIPLPSLSALQRVLLRDGLVTFEDVGIYKDDRFKSGDTIIPQNTQIRYNKATLTPLPLHMGPWAILPASYQSRR